MPWWGDLLVAATILVAAVGCIVPVLPGGLIAWAAILVWSLVEHSVTGWLVLAAATLLIAVGQVAKYLWPGRQLARSGVPGSTILAGGLLGIVGFFVIPVVGLPLGFLVGVFLVEVSRSRTAAVAWASTVSAMKATGLSILIELASVLLAGSVWFAGVVASS